MRTSGPSASTQTIIAIAAAPTPAGLPEIVTYEGVCDASAVVWRPDTGELLVGADEDNVLRTYVEAGGAPVRSTDLTSYLGAVPSGYGNGHRRARFEL